MRFKIIRPFVMFSSDSKKKKAKTHPHIVIGIKDDKYVSMSVTHSNKVKGKKTVPLPDNIERSYMVITPYVKKKEEYSTPRYQKDYRISSRDRLIAEKYARSYKEKRVKKK